MRHLVIVLDASAALEWLLVRAGAEAVADRLRDPDITVHSPSLMGVEVAAALRGLVLGGHDLRTRIARTPGLGAVVDVVDTA